MRSMTMALRLVLVAVLPASCGATAGAKSDTSTPNTGTGHALRSVLNGHGIDNTKFGESRTAVTTALTRLLGPNHETLTSNACRSDHETDWIGLNIRLRTQDPRLSAELMTFFRQSRFVGYAYFANEDGARRQRSGVLLATTRGLALGDTVARARQLYRHSFAATSAEWKIRTGNQRIYGHVQGTGSQNRVTAHTLVTSIAASAGSTPCY